MTIFYTVIPWVYAGSIAGLLARSLEEPGYATLLMFPLILGSGETPLEVIVGFTIANTVNGLLQILTGRTRFGHFQVWPMIGVVMGVISYLLLGPVRAVYMVSLVLFALSLRLGYEAITGRGLRLMARGILRVLFNMSVGFLDAVLGTTVAFSFAGAFLDPTIEALAPFMRGLEATLEVSLKEETFVGGFTGGLMLFLTQGVRSELVLDRRVMKAVISLVSVGTALSFVYLV